MNEEILKLILEYSKTETSINKSFIEKLMEIVVNGKNLGIYVQHLEFLEEFIPVDEQLITMAMYDEEEKTIVVSIPGILLAVSDQKKLAENLGMSKEEVLLHQTLFVAQTILHEIEHANQEKIINSKENNDEKRILEISRRAMGKFAIDIPKFMRSHSYQPMEEILMQIAELQEKNRKKYHRTYDYDPKERLADIKSRSLLLDVIAPLEPTVPRLIASQQQQQLKDQLRGYNKKADGIISPIVRYVNDYGLQKNLDVFTWYNKGKISFNRAFVTHPLETRLMLGFPIKVEEHEQVEKKLKLGAKK